MKPKVLLVDDEAEFRQLIEYNLLRQDFEVYTAANGLDGLNEARRILPDVILLDLMLPDLDGLTVCQLLHVQPSTSNVPVIIISALVGRVISAQSNLSGVASYVPKPVDLQSLGGSIRAALARPRAQLLERKTADQDTGEEDPVETKHGV